MSEYTLHIFFKNKQSHLVDLGSQPNDEEAQRRAVGSLVWFNLLDIEWVGVLKIEGTLPIDIKSLMPKFTERYPDGLPYKITTFCRPDKYKKKFAYEDEAKAYAIKLATSPKTKALFKIPSEDKGKYGQYRIFCDGPGMDGPGSLVYGYNDKDGEWYFSGGW